MTMMNNLNVLRLCYAFDFNNVSCKQTTSYIFHTFCAVLKPQYIWNLLFAQTNVLDCDTNSSIVCAYRIYNKSHVDLVMLNCCVCYKKWFFQKGLHFKSGLGETKGGLGEA